METLEIKIRESIDYEAQLTFLIKRDFFVTFYKFKYISYYLNGVTLILLGIILFTPHDSLLSLKAVSILMLSFFWICYLVYSITIIYKWYNRNKWKRESITLAKKDESSYKFYFDNEKLSFETSTYKTELTWDYYTYWIENKNSIFLFTKSNIYEALYYSESDLGKTNYLELKNIASEKLEKLDN